MPTAQEKKQYLQSMDPEQRKRVVGSMSPENRIKLANEIKSTGQQPKEDSGNLLEQARVGVESFLSGSTAGLSNPILSGLESAIETAVDNVAGDSPERESLIEQLKREYSEATEQRESREEAHPGTALAGEIAGTIAPTPFNVGAKIFQGARALTGASKLAKGAGLGKKIAAEAGAGAIGTVGFEGTRAASDVVAGSDPNVDASTLGTGAGVGAAIGGAFPIAGAALRQGGKLGKFALSKITNTSPKFIEDFIANGKKIRNAKTEEELIQQMEVGANAAKIIGQDAEEFLAEALVEVIKKRKKDIIRFNDAADRALDTPKKISTPLAALSKQKRHTALNQLATQGKISKRGLDKILKKAEEKFAIEGEKLNIGEAKTFSREIFEVRDTLDRLPKFIHPLEARKFVKKLRKASTFLEGEGQFGTETSNVLTKFAAEVNGRIRVKHPRFAEIMDNDLQPATEFVANNKDLIGKPEDALKFVKSFTAEAKQVSPVELKGKLYPPRQERILDSKFAQAEGTIDELALIEKKEAIAHGIEIGKLRGASAQTKLSSYMKAFNEGSLINQVTKNQFESLAKLSNKDFIKEVELSALKSGFDKIGVKDPSLFDLSVYGGGGAFIISNIFPIGYVGAAAIGAILRAVGPVAAKQVLFGLANMKGMPTVAKINQMTMPKEAKDILISQLLRTVAVSSEDKSKDLQVDSDESMEEFRKHIKKSESPIEKAKKLNKLNKDRKISVKDMLEYIESGKAPEGSRLKEMLQRQGFGRDK